MEPTCSDRPIGQGKAWSTPVQPTQRATKPSASTDNVTTFNVVALNQTLSGICQQLGDLSTQLSAHEQWVSAAESWSPGPPWPWEHSQPERSLARSYLESGSQLSKDPPRDGSLKRQSLTGATGTHPHQSYFRLTGSSNR